MRVKINCSQQYFHLYTIQKNISEAVFEYQTDRVKDGNNIDISHIIEFNPFYSTIRIYRDIFLTYNQSTK